MTRYSDGMLSVGTSVDIQRTDGRVHSAFVSGINTAKNSVTVEWYEKGEAKGKEIELEAIFQLNPNLRQIIPSSDDVGGTGDVTTLLPSGTNGVTGSSQYDHNAVSRFAAPTTGFPAQVRMVPRSQDDRTNQARFTAVQLSAPSATNATISQAGADFLRSRGQDNNVPQSAAHRVTNGSAAEVSDSTPATVSTVAADLDADNLTHLGDLARDPDTGSLYTDWMEQDGVETGEDTSVGVAAGNRHLATDGQKRANYRVASSATAPTNTSFTAAPQRKSNCVKEIERIQQRREERRAAQRAVKDQVELDPSNPSYEFHSMITEYRNTLDYRPLTNADPIEDHQICVCVRKRPMNRKEVTRKEIDVITIPNKQMVIVHEPKTKVDLTKYLENQQFRFDYTFDDSADNELVYRYTARPLVESIFERGMATCFAYGQTGSGKTHTMGGEFHSPGQQNCTSGIYALAAADLFNLNSTKYRHEKLRVDAAFFEIYGGKVFDLLNKKNKLRVLEDAKGQVQIVGLREEPVDSVDSVLQLLQHGQHIRTSGQTSANQHSSRSHAVFQLILKKQNKLHGKFSLIDLAGNERGVDTSSSDRHTRMEGAEINKSLLALKECIRALGRKGAHLPFRVSKLTHVLRDSFIGDRSRTCMIAMISPGMSSCEHTLNTLRYANRVKELGPAGAPSNGTNTELPPISSRNGPPSNRATAASTGAAGAQGDANGTPLLPPTLRPSYLCTAPSPLEDEDMAMIRSANNGEVNDDLLTFQEVITQIERMEEDVCDDHRALCALMPEWTKEHFRLHKMSNQVEFDIEAYSTKLEHVLAAQIKTLSALKEKVSIWRRELRQEEELSNRLQRGARL